MTTKGYILSIISEEQLFSKNLFPVLGITSIEYLDWLTIFGLSNILCYCFLRDNYNDD